MDELGRNPDFMLRALYSDRPHQYHEVNEENSWNSLCIVKAAWIFIGWPSLQDPGDASGAHECLLGAQEAFAAEEGGLFGEGVQGVVLHGGAVDHRLQSP